MKPLYILILLLIFKISHATNNDSIDYYLNMYNFNKVISILNKKTSKTIDDYKTLGNCYYKIGDNKDAEQNYILALKIDSLDKNSLFNLGKIYYNVSEYNMSKLYFTKLYFTDTNNLYYLKQLSKINIKTRNFDIAKHQLKKIIKNNPKDINSAVNLINIYYSEHKYLTADSLINLKLADNLINKNMLNYKIKISYILDNYNDVIKYSKKYISSYNPTKSIYKLLGLSFYNINLYDSAINYLTKINRYKDSEIVCYYIGLSYFKKNDFNKSKYYFTKAIDNGVSDNVTNYYKYLAFSCDNNKEYKLAIDNFKKAYKFSKKDVFLYYLAIVYDKYYKDKKIAIKYYEKYLSQTDTNNQDYFNYSKYRLRLIKEKAHFYNDSL